jgi:hypothetical protein
VRTVRKRRFAWKAVLRLPATLRRMGGLGPEERRLNILHSIVGLEEPIDRSLRELKAFDQSSAEALVTVSVENVRHVLDWWSEGQASVGEVGDWANALKARTEIRFATPAVSDAVDQLAVSGLELTPSLAGKLRESLG